MESKERPIHRRILNDPHLWIAFGLAVIFIGMEILHVFNKLKEGPALHWALTVIVICIVMLAADGLKKEERGREDSATLGRIVNTLDGIAADGGKREELERETFEKLSRLVVALSDKKVALRKRPSKPEEYDCLWGGFTGSYNVYNPSYKVDQYTGDEDIATILARRYQNPHFDKARYIFLTGDVPGQDALKRFHGLMALVKQKCPGVVKKVEVRELTERKASATSEVYLGMRDGEPTAVVELKESHQHGMPHYYLIIHDKDVCDHYHQDHFEPSWIKATDVKEFWDDKSLR